VYKELERRWKVLGTLRGTIPDMVDFINGYISRVRQSQKSMRGAVYTLKVPH
jgi:hypothetical protein